jgi:hypothetical protein
MINGAPLSGGTSFSWDRRLASDEGDNGSVVKWLRLFCRGTRVDLVPV